MKRELPNVTLITVDCLHLERSKVCADICQKNFEFAAVKILSSVPDSDPRVVAIPPLLNGKAYSDFYINELYKYVDTPLALTFHHDSFIANPEAWDDEFLKCDYIASPWYHPGAYGLLGNGGFAIRSRRLMEFAAKNREKISGPYEPEDLWLCKFVRPFAEKKGMRWAPLEIAKRWAKEGNERGVVWNGEFGWHDIRGTDMSKWFEIHPKYKEIFIQKFDDYTAFMRKYPVYDGSWHVLPCKPIQVDAYKRLASEEKKYDCRMDDDLQWLDRIKPGHKIIYRLWRILFSQVNVPTFERTVSAIEKFSSKSGLLKAHPDIEITPSFYLPKWKQRLQQFLGNIVFPNNASYTLILLEK